MEPVTSILSAILKVLQQIARAEKEARRNKERCRDLAERAKVVSSVLREAKAAAPGRKNDDGAAAAAAARRMILRRLRDALDDALKLIESCGGGRDDAGCGFLGPWVAARLNGGARAARFHDVDKRINNCLFELSAASGASIEKKIDRLSVASARGHQPGANKQKKEAKAGNAPQKGATGQGGQNGGKGAKKRKGKKKNAPAAGSRPPPPPQVADAPQNGHSCTAYNNHYHSVEEDPNSCSVM